MGDGGCLAKDLLKVYPPEWLLEASGVDKIWRFQKTGF
jgi:hypothetical protein